MRGLLMKDLELIKINMKMYLAVFLIGIIYLVAQENGSTFFVAYAIFVSISVSVGTISYDGYHHGMKFLMTLPVTKKQYVQSKYLLSFGFAVLVSVISLLLGMIRIQISGKQEAEDLLISAGTALVISCIINTLRNDSASLEIRSREKQDCYGGGGSSNLSGGCCM